MIFVNSYSGWIDVKVMEDTRGHSVVEYLRDFMANFGLISILVF